MKKRPTLDPKQFKHKTPIAVMTERFMVGERQRLMREGEFAGLRGEALSAWVKLTRVERKRVLESRRRIQQAIAPVLTTQTGRLSSRGPNAQNVPRSISGRSFTVSYVDDPIVTPPRHLTPEAARVLVANLRKEYEIIEQYLAEVRAVLKP